MAKRPVNVNQSVEQPSVVHPPVPPVPDQGRPVSVRSEPRGNVANPDAEPTPVPETPEPLDANEVVRDEREESITIDKKTYHHIREARDGRWIYAPLKPRD